MVGVGRGLSPCRASSASSFVDYPDDSLRLIGYWYKEDGYHYPDVWKSSVISQHVDSMLIFNRKAGRENDTHECTLMIL